MTTQVIEFVAPSGLTVTAKLFDNKTDTIVGSTFTCTERTNKKGFYTFSGNDIPDGLYDLTLFVGANVLGVDQVFLYNVNGTYQVNSLLLQGNGSYTVAIPGVLQQSNYDNTLIPVYRGTTWSISFTNLGNISAATQIFCTVRKKTEDTDGKSLLQVSLTGGLLVFNESSSHSSGLATLVVTDSILGNITITVNASLTVNAPIYDHYNCDLKVLRGTVDLINFNKRFMVLPDVTRRIS